MNRKSTEIRRFLGFRFRNSERSYLVDMARLYRVERDLPFYPLPWSRPGLLGICRSGDWVLPVVDLRFFLPQEQGEPGPDLFMVMSPDGLVAFAVGEILAGFDRSAILRMEKTDNRLLPVRVETREGVHNLLNLRYILDEGLKKLWTS